MATQIKITADTSSAQREIDRLGGSLSDLDKTNQAAAKSMSGLGQTAKLAVGAFAALTAAVGVREIVDYTARWTDLNSRLVNATGSQAAAKEALDAISASAKTTYSSLEETAKVFVRNSMAMNELGYTTNEQIKVTEALNNAIAVSGARGAEAASALDAFAQAIARGKMEGGDFNRIIETSPRIVKALADGLGVTTGELRRMITEGTITSDVMIPALLTQMGKLREEAEAMPATISDAFILLENSIFEFIGSTDEALGISQALSKALVFLASNTGIMVGAIGGLAVAVAALLIPLIPAATAMAILTGGLAVAGAVAVGAAIGYAAQQAGLFSKESKAAVDSQKEQTTAAENAAAAVARQAAAAKKVVEEQTRGLAPLFDKIKLEQESFGLSQSELAVKRNLAEAAKTLKVEESQLTDTVRNRVITSTQALETARQQHTFAKVLKDLEIERLGIGIQDKNQREIILAIRQQELDFGRSLNAVEKESLTNAIQKTQQAREQAGIAEAIYNATRKQTELEKINRGLSLQSKLDPQGAAATDYSKDMEGLQAMLDNKLISEQQYFAQREALSKQHNQKLKDFELTRINESLMAERNAMATALSDKDRAIIQSVGAEERQKAIVADRINFEKKSDSEKTQFAIDNAQQVFAALGAQNKKAFEASKALAIASAIMNTYQGATKALATYPFPFNLIAAAASIAAGMAQVSAIRSQQYQGRQLGGPVMGGQTYMVGENGPEMFTPNTTGSITRNGDLGRSEPVTVNFNIVANDTAGFDALLTSRESVIKQIITDAMLERGQRSMI